MARNSRRWIVVAVACVAAIGGGYAYWHHHFYKHFAIHEPGVVYRSAWLEPAAMSKVLERYKIRTVVNLCKPGEMGEQRWQGERQLTADLGAKLIELEMPTTLEAGDPAIARHLEVLNEPGNYPMLVHCQHGMTRTAKFLAIYDMTFRGMTAQETLSSQPLFGRDDQHIKVRKFCRNYESEFQRLYPLAATPRREVLTN